MLNALDGDAFRLQDVLHKPEVTLADYERLAAICGELVGVQFLFFLVPRVTPTVQFQVLNVLYLHFSPPFQDKHQS